VLDAAERLKAAGAVDVVVEVIAVVELVPEAGERS
jgi:hypothetical protein